MTEETKTNVAEPDLTPGAEEAVAVTEPVVDYKAKYEEAQALIQQQESNYKAMQRNLEAARRQGADPAILKDILGELAELRKSQSLSLDYLAGGELTPEMRQIMKQEQEERSKLTERERREWGEATAELVGVLNEENIDLGDQRVQEFSRRYPDPRQALRHVDRFLRRIERETTKPSPKPEDAEAKATAARRRDLEAAGELAVETRHVTAKSGAVKGRKPTFEEVQAATPEEFDAKLKSGEWKVF